MTHKASLSRQADRSVSTRRDFLSIGTINIVSLGVGGSAYGKMRKRFCRRRGPAVHTQKRGNPPVVVGEKDHRYQVQHDWARLPDHFSWQTTHNVAVDSEENLYVIHEGMRERKGHPAIFVLCFVSVLILCSIRLLL